MKYLWTEDTGAGLHFWQLLNQLFFENAFDKLVTWTGIGKADKSRFEKMFCRQLRIIESTCQRLITRSRYSI